MAKTPYLVKRGHMFWWRRRKPVFIVSQPSNVIFDACTEAGNARLRMTGHFAFSLRTACPREAGRRAARLNFLFEEKRRTIETTMSRTDGMGDERYLDRAMADLAATLRAHAEMLAQQMAQPSPVIVASTHPSVAKSPGAGPDVAQPRPAKKSSSRIDDPEFERAVLELADQEGWQHDDPDEIVNQFDMMLTGLFTLQEEYLRYCVRKGLDPAKALPTLAPLGGALESAKNAIQGPEKSDTVPEATAAARDGRTSKGRSGKSNEGRKFSEHARRFLDLRSQGYDLKRHNETPDTMAGERFTTTSRSNFEGTIRLFKEAHGDIPVEHIDADVLNSFFSILERIPANHGKSRKDNRPIREVIEETDRDERNKIERRKAEMQRDGLTAGEIEEGLDDLRVRRLRTNTCKRHMDTMDQIMAFAVFEGLRTDNPVKEVKWTNKEIKRRLANEEDADRLPWGDKLPKLLGSPIYRSPLDEPGDPMFWAPLLALFAGFRMEEALQLRTDDFDTEDGVPIVKVQIHGTTQSRKSKAAKRGVPIHDSLLDLGILQLVQLRRSANQTRLFTYLERGQAKNTLSEIFSKRFTHYRKKHGIYERARDFHSLRKDFQTKLTRARVPQHSRKLLMGHQLTDITHKHYYPEGDTIEMMAEYINRIDVDCSRVLRPFATLSDTNVHALPTTRLSRDAI